MTVNMASFMAHWFLIWRVPIVKAGCLLLFGLMLLSFQIAEAIAEESGGTLVLNSNAAVKNYESAQAAFTANSLEIRAKINLGDSSVDIDQVKKQIQQVNPDIIYAIGSKAYLLAHEIAEDKKIIFSSVLNWQRLPMSENSYGVSNELSPGMQLMTYRYLFPAVKKIGVIYSERFNKEWLSGAIETAEDVGMEIISTPIAESAELMPALEKLLPEVDVLWLISDPVVLASQESVLKIFSESAAMQKPVIAYAEIFSTLGATLVISADISTMGLQAASLARELLEHKKVLQPVVDPAGSYIMLNMKKVKEYGLDLNNEALGSVNQIIE
jgi:putative ABC transport system substrate-binding protein